MKIPVLYTMKGCPFCKMIKEEFDKENVIYVERDIDDYPDEFDEFSKKTNSDYLPALMLLTVNDDDEETDVQFMVPEKDFNDIYEAVEKTKNYILD